MDYFEYRQGKLYCEGVYIGDIVKAFGTPCYIYSRKTLERHIHAFENALGEHPHMICYSVKANGNLGVLNVIAKLGAGFDIVSVGELERVIAAGGDPTKVVFSGVAKQNHEIERALDVNIHCFNVESHHELFQINDIAKTKNKVAPISLRVNPDVDAGTHPYIATGLKENKFGIDVDEAYDLYLEAAKLPHIKIKGIDCHIGSQLTQLTPFLDALERLLVLVNKLKEQGITIAHIDLGGGLGVRYGEETPPAPAEQASEIIRYLDAHGLHHLKVILEPGRAIAANAGIFVTQVQFIKNTPYKNFAVVDGAMNDLIRPALYEAWHPIIPVNKRENGKKGYYDIVGPVCETGDFLGRQRELRIEAQDLLAVRTAGAYGFVMSSNYNARPRPPEIIVDGDQYHCVRRRETVTELFSQEQVIP